MIGLVTVNASAAAAVVQTIGMRKNEIPLLVLCTRGSLQTTTNIDAWVAIVGT